MTTQGSEQNGKMTWIPDALFLRQKCTRKGVITTNEEKTYPFGYIHGENP